MPVDRLRLRDAAGTIAWRRHPGEAPAVAKPRRDGAVRPKKIIFTKEIQCYDRCASCKQEKINSYQEKSWRKFF
jgi:hypothetical protein